jgi:hypothetical protein
LAPYGEVAGGAVSVVPVVVVAGVWTAVDVAAAAGVVETVVVRPLAAGLGAAAVVEVVTGVVVEVVTGVVVEVVTGVVVEVVTGVVVEVVTGVVVEVVTGVVVPVGAVGAGGAMVLLIGVVVLVGPGLWVPLLDVTGGVTWLVGSATALPVFTGGAGEVLGATLLGLVVTGLGPAPVEPAEPEAADANPLGDPELAVVGLVKLLVGLVKLLVGLVMSGLGPAPAELAEPDGAEANPLGDPALAVVGVRLAVVEPVMAPEPVVPEAAVPEPVLPLAKPDVTGLVALDDAEAPTGPLAALLGLAAPSDIWITGMGPVENVPDPIAVTPLPPSTLYIIW